MAKHNWTREELIVALNLYCKISFKESRASHPLVIEYAKLIGRSPAAMNLKIGNLGRFDPLLQAKGITGLVNGSKLDECVWNEFMSNPEALSYESERIIAKLRKTNVENILNVSINDLPQGIEKERVVRQRVNQQFFRDSVIAAYHGTCCVSGVTTPSLIEACHISPWAEDVKNRTNPANGLCLNSFFHKAFDNWLFTITPDYVIDIKQELIDSIIDDNFRSYLVRIKGSEMNMPEKFAPDINLLNKHYIQYSNM
ncbi:MAG: HNH endonuclease [Muribaculaceae bacterium]|nr:HNH endonuclease [Muribaculaceae bacterium]